MVKRGREVDMEYSKKIIMNKMNTFFGNNVVEKIKLITFEGKTRKIQRKNTKRCDKKPNILEKFLVLKMRKLKILLLD